MYAKKGRNPTRPAHDVLGEAYILFHPSHSVSVYLGLERREFLNE